MFLRNVGCLPSCRTARHHNTTYLRLFLMFSRPFSPFSLSFALHHALSIPFRCLTIFLGLLNTDRGHNQFVHFCHQETRPKNGDNEYHILRSVFEPTINDWPVSFALSPQLEIKFPLVCSASSKYKELNNLNSNLI
jgi:hypothetical protein